MLKAVKILAVLSAFCLSSSAQQPWPGQPGNLVGHTASPTWTGSFNATACGAATSGTSWATATVKQNCTYSTTSHTTISCSFCEFINVDFKSTATADNNVLISGSHILFFGDRFQSNCLQCANVSMPGSDIYFMYTSFTPLTTFYTSPPGFVQWPGAGAGANTRTLTSGVNGVADNQGYEIGLLPNNGSGPFWLDHSDLWGYGNAVQWLNSITAQSTVTSNWTHDTASPNVTGGAYHSDGIVGYLNGNIGPNNLLVVGNATGMMGNTQGLALQASTGGYQNIFVNENFWSGDNTTVAWCQPGTVRCTNSAFYGNVFGTDIMDDGAVYAAGSALGTGTVWACNTIEFLAGTTWTNLDGWHPTSAMNGQFFINALPPNSATDQGGNTVCANTTPAALTWFRQQTGTSSTKTVTLKATGSSSLTGISAALATGTNYSIQANTCGSTLASGASCAITLQFSPSSFGPLADTLLITNNSPGASSPQRVPLLGIGASTTDGGGGATFSISGTVSPATGSTAPSPLTVTLSGGASATQSTASYNFTGLTSGLNYTVTPTATGYTFSPTSATFNALAANQTQNFTATGTANPALQPLSDFGSEGIGITSAAQATSLVNSTGTGPLTGIAISITGTNASDFAVASTACTATLNAGSVCSIQVTFTPTDVGARSATLQVVDNIGTQTRPLTGTGFQPPTPSCSPPGGSFKSGRKVVCSNVVPAATMCFNMGTPPTTNGAGTCTSGTTYTKPFMVASSGTLFVTGTQSGNTDQTVSYPFTITPSWTTGWIMNDPTPGTTTFGTVLNAGIGPPRFLGSTQSTAVITQPTQPTMASVNSTGYAYSAPGDPYYPTTGRGNCYTALTDINSTMTGSAHASLSGGGSNVMSDINRAYFALTDDAGAVRYFHAFYDVNGCMQRDTVTMPTSPSGGTGAGFSFSRGVAARAYKVAPSGKQAPGDPATGTILYQEALSGTTTITITRTKLFDYNNCPGVDGTLTTQGGNGNLNVDYQDRFYSTSLNWPPAINGQDGAHWVLVWDRATNSCATYYTGVVQNTENPANGNVWTWCTGNCSQHGSNPAPLALNTLCDPNGYGVHNTAAGSDGTRVGISGKCGGPTTSDNSTQWLYGTNTLQTCDLTHFNCGGHGTSGFSYGWSANNNIAHRPLFDLTTWTVIRPLLAAGTDQHGGDNWIGPAADVNPWLASAHSNVVANPCGAVPYCGELLAIKLDGNVVRFGPNFHQWTGAANDLGPIMSMTQDGYCIVFESTWNHTRGTDAGGVFHKDLFSICNLQ